jgi:pyrimidine operon attenuation protein/uracil phosphoribosyltransferase
MGKGIVALNREIRKKEFEATELGKAQKKLKQFYGDYRNKELLTEEDAKWVTEHRNDAQFKQEALEHSHNKELDELNDKYAKLVDDVLLDAVTKELNYINNLCPSN